MVHDVFISHSSKDKNTADAVCSILEQNKIRCWIAPRDVIPGKNYAACITEAIRSSKFLVIIFSSNSNASGPVTNELEIALRHGVIIIPFKIEDVEPSQALEYYLGSRHWLDALSVPIEKHILKLSQTIKNFGLNENKANNAPSPDVNGTKKDSVNSAPPEEEKASENVLLVRVLDSSNPFSLGGGIPYVFTIDKKSVITIITGGIIDSKQISLPVGQHDVELKVFAEEDTKFLNPFDTIRTNFLIKKDKVTELNADRGRLFKGITLTVNYI